MPRCRGARENLMLFLDAETRILAVVFMRVGNDDPDSISSLLTNLPVFTSREILTVKSRTDKPYGAGFIASLLIVNFCLILAEEV